MPALLQGPVFGMIVLANLAVEYGIGTIGGFNDLQHLMATDSRLKTPDFHHRFPQIINRNIFYFPGNNT